MRPFDNVTSGCSPTAGLTAQPGTSTGLAWYFPKILDGANGRPYSGDITWVNGSTFTVPITGNVTFTPPETPNDATTTSQQSFEVADDAPVNLYYFSATGVLGDGTQEGTGNAGVLVYYPVIDPINTSTTYVLVQPGGAATYTFSDATNGADGPMQWIVWSGIPQNATSVWQSQSTLAPYSNTLTIQTTPTTPLGETAMGILVYYNSPICRQNANGYNADVLIDVETPSPTPSPSPTPTASPTPSPSPQPTASGCGSGGGFALPKRGGRVMPFASSCPIQSYANPAIDEVYVTQVAQFSKYTAPTLAKVSLVAGRQAEVRVFAVTAPTDAPLAPMPTIRVKLGGQTLANIAPPAPNPFPSGLPKTLTNADELNIKHSYNYTIPASLMTAGNLSLEAVVLSPAGTETTISRTITVNVLTVSPLVVRLVPLSIDGKTGSTSNVGTALVTKYWPFPSASYPSHPSLAVNLSASNTAGANDELIIDKLEQFRKNDKLIGFYYGLLPAPPDGTSVDCGAAYESTSNDGSSRSAFGADTNAYEMICPAIGNENHVMPHELAHAFSLEHAPCGGAANPDPWFADHGAQTGDMISDGWDFSNSTVPNGSTTSDVMGYCSTYWVGAYDWNTVLKFFQTGPPANSPNPTSTANTDLKSRELLPLANDEQAIHIFALVSPISITLLNSFTDFGSPFHAAKTGPVTFEGLDSDGVTLFTAQGPFLFVHKTDPVGSSIIDVPLAASLVSRLTQLRISYMGRSLTQKSLPPGPPKAVAIAIDATHVRVTFDGRHFGAITTRPSATSSDNSQGLDGDGTANSGGILENNYPDLYVDFTDGIKTVATHVKVHVSGR